MIPILSLCNIVPGVLYMLKNKTMTSNNQKEENNICF